MSEGRARATVHREVPPLDAPGHTALHAGIATAIRNAFFAGTIRPGDRLVEVDIARQLGVSRAPVREALQELVREGLLVHSPRRGMSVVQFTARDVREIYVVRIALAHTALELVIARASDADLAGLQRPVDLIDQSGHAGDFAARQRAVLGFHEELFRLAGNSRLTAAWQALRGQVFATLYLLGSHRRDTALVVHDHTAIVNAMRARDLPGAQRLVRQIITTSGERLARQLEAEAAGHETVSAG